MNEIVNTTFNPALKPIVAPSLNEAGYAEALNTAFVNIDDNFTTLANYDFIKGENGSSVIIRNTPFYVKNENDEDVLSYYGQLLKKYIEDKAEQNEDEQADIILNTGEVLNIFDNFTPENAGSIQMVFSYENDLTTTATPVSSLYYVFLDGRYASKKTGFADPEQYINTKDFSCIVVYDGNLNDGVGGFTSLDNAFPTIYYENNVGLCWKINGSETGLPVQGIPGKDGSNASMYIVRSTETINDSNNLGENTQCIVSGIYESIDGYLSVEEYKDDYDIAALDNQSALILGPDPNSNSMLFYFGKLSYDAESDILYAFCNISTSINTAIDNEAFINSMRSISILNNGNDASSGLKGLFVPIEIRTNEETQKVHLLSAASIANVDGINNDLKTDVIFTPVSDINTLNISEDSPLHVEKYMYLKINIDAFDPDVLSVNDNILNIGTGYLKYKLTSIVTDKNSNFLGKYSVNNTSGSRYYGSIIDNIQGSEGDVIDLNDKNTDDSTINTIRYVNANDSDATPSMHHYDSIPYEFNSRMKLNDENADVAGIYMWVLDTEKDEFDIDELYHGTTSETYNFAPAFNRIFTTTVTPGIDTKFMWFNGFYLHEDYRNERYPADTNQNRLYVLSGWNNSNEFFDFVKFVPIYSMDDTYKISEDTALNLNYNVNITGDRINPNKNINVHGNVNCDNLSVYKLAATGSIKDIYTEDDIIGAKGISLGASRADLANNKEPNCKITQNGDILANSAKLNYADIETIDADGTISSKILETNDLKINIETDDSTEAYFNCGKSPNVNNSIDTNLFGVNQININSIYIDDINGNINVPTKISDVPVINSNMSTHEIDDAVITLSNQSTDGDNIYLKNTLARVNGASANDAGDPGKGAYDYNGHTDIIQKTSFESAKNFNMHRLSLEDIKSSETLSTIKDTGTCMSEERLSVDYTGSYANYIGDLAETKTESITANNITNHSIQKMILKKPNNSNIRLNRNKPIEVVFKDDFVCHVGLYGGCSKGGWPALNDNSKLTIQLYYSIDGGNTVHAIQNPKNTYTFDYSTSNTSDNNGFEWVGYNKDGTYLSGNYNNQWRYYAFRFRCHKMTITLNNDAYKKIAAEYDAGGSVTIYAVATFDMHAHTCENMWGNRKQLVCGIRAYTPRPIKSNSSNGAIKLVKYKYGEKEDFEDCILTDFNSSNITGYLSYSIVTTSTTNTPTVNATNICNDGIVIRAGKYVFGLGNSQGYVDHSKAGYEMVANADPTWKATNESSDQIVNINEPILFYHEYNPNYYDINKIPKGSASREINGYAKRMNAIPLKDIFETIKFIRKNKAIFEKLGFTYTDI